MAITETHTGSASISTAEYSCPNASTSLTPITDDGAYQFFLDVAAMVAGDKYQVRVYEKCTSDGTQRVVFESILAGAQADPLWVSPCLILMHGWDFTVKRLAGSDRTLYWSIRKP